MDFGANFEAGFTKFVKANNITLKLNHLTIRQNGDNHPKMLDLYKRKTLASLSSNCKKWKEIDVGGLIEEHCGSERQSYFETADCTV